jgi:hypothetical protein
MNNENIEIEDIGNNRYLVNKTTVIYAPCYNIALGRYKAKYTTEETMDSELMRKLETLPYKNNNDD